MKISALLFILTTIILMPSCKKSKEAADQLNRWDGIYRMEGMLVDYKDATITWPGNTHLYSMETLSSTEIQVKYKDNGNLCHLVNRGGTLGNYGYFALIVTFDPATNKITGVTNAYGQAAPSHGLSAVLDPSGANTWDPATKNIKLKYWMDEAGFAGHRTSFDETWVYVGAR